MALPVKVSLRSHLHLFFIIVLKGLESASSFLYKINF